MRTAIISHPHCRKHKMIIDHPECPERLDAIADRLLASGLDIAIEQKQAPKASREHYLLVHDESLVKHVENTLPKEGLASLDGDTWLCPDSLKAVERAVGAGLLAVDEVLADNLDAAFCSVRPPGHHATRSVSSGFCVYNNLAIAVRYAQSKGVKRIAIVDFDVHHGNGTQDIFMDDDSVLFCSLFQYPFYPNTAIENNATLVNSPLPIASDGNDLKALYTQQWLPKLSAFKPELIFISAGFDAHLEDDMASLKFVEEDYIWLTEQLASMSQELNCKGIISYLEGGYALSALGRSAVAHIKALVDS
ncbi:histone deacetylase family protein [Pseudoalteromonas sp. H105]|jgi:acetoin utilization deacetylase AcuC-like enzyme|uniref:histone deacetylase family protein n=1 Tax=Pseudoalteromonas sp. H105 TaxID=1348393 RepID=UPI00073243FF|nr:histone deacetylase family protein [Pseudoalteromonas sp. H105]KTF12167.1 deacetylase [Pseudoalteromonas sp. H105]